jgi:hypothetical protein
MRRNGRTGDDVEGAFPLWQHRLDLAKVTVHHLTRKRA